MNLQQFFTILWARRKIFFFVLGFAVAATLIVSLVLPKQYVATASVVVDVKSPDPVGGLILPAQIMPGYMATQIDIIRSQKVAIKVIKMLKLDQNPDVIQDYRDETDGAGSIEVWMADRIGRYLDVQPSRESSVIAISYQSTNPKFAALLANAFAQAYIESTLELKVEPARQYATWFDERTKQLRDSLELAQAKLSAYQRKKGIVAADERLDVESARLADLSNQLVAVQGQSADAQSRLKQVGTGSNETLQEVLQNPLIQGLKGDLARLEAKLQEMSANVGKNHPQYKRAEMEIKELRQRVADETDRVTAGISTSQQVSRQKEQEIHNTLEAQRQKVLSLKKQRDEISVLQRDVESAQRAYDMVTQRLAQSSLESQATQTNIAVLNPAYEPIEHSSPKILLNMILSVFLGTMLAVGCTQAMEILDRRVRSVEDIREFAGMPVLGVLARDDRPARWLTWIPPRFRPGLTAAQR